MKSTQQLVGRKFNRLTVMECLGKDKGRNVIWRCLCDCGKETIARGSALLSGAKQSCGCWLKDSPIKKAAMKKVGLAKVTHGYGHTPTYNSWTAMMHRCLNPKRRGYENYGARGIVPCAFLKETVLNLVKLIGEQPDNQSIERMNNNAGYTCGTCDECVKNGWVLNVKWATRAEQSRNKRNTHWVTIGCISKLRHEWAKELGVTIGMIRSYERKQIRNETASGSSA